MSTTTAWMSPAQPPQGCAELYPGSIDRASRPVLVVEARPDGSREQLVATYRSSDDEPHDNRWVSTCPMGRVIKSVTAWRELDWPNS